MNATGHVPEFWPRLFDMFGVIRRFSINTWVEILFFCIDWEKSHGLKCTFFRSDHFFWMFKRWLILSWHVNTKTAASFLSLITYYSGWMSCLISFVLASLWGTQRKAKNSKWKWMSLAGIKPAGIKKATRCNIGIKLIMVRYIYWNWLSDKICISFTNVDVISYCLQNLVWIHETIIHLINVLASVEIIHMP